MIAEGLVSAGARVLICARKEADVRDAEKSLGVEGIVADLSKEEGVAALAAGIRARTPKLDILVNNAGTAWGAEFGRFPRSGFEKTLNLNLIAVFDLIQALHPLLRDAGTPGDPARVINISSVDGITPPNGPTFPYSASKAGLNMLTRHLAATLVNDNITCNAIAPGLFETRFSAHMLDPAHPRYDDRPSIPMGRIGTPEDMAGAVIYLSSRAGSYLTGTILPVSGGVSCL